MKNKKIPMRSCVVTKEKLPKVELLRIVKTPEGNVLADITGKLNDNNRFTTPNINTSTTLNVVYESSADGISSTKVSSAKILGTSFGIKVENARPNEVLKVYTIDGKLVKSQKLQSSEVDVELPNNETYIINLEDLRVKVRL